MNRTFRELVASAKALVGEALLYFVPAPNGLPSAGEYEASIDVEDGGRRFRIEVHGTQISRPDDPFYAKISEGAYEYALEGGYAAATLQAVYAFPDHAKGTWKTDYLFEANR